MLRVMLPVLAGIGVWVAVSYALALAGEPQSFWWWHHVFGVVG